VCVCVCTLLKGKQVQEMLTKVVTTHSNIRK